MTASTIGAVAATLLACASGCSASYSYSLEPIPPASSKRHDCTLGVAPITDPLGVDYGYAVAEHFEASGPCEKVVRVVGASDPDADLVLSGEMAARIGPSMTAEEVGATWGLMIGIPIMLGGATLLVVGNTVVDSSARDSFNIAGAAVGGAGGALFLYGLISAISASARDAASGEGSASAELNLRRGSNTIESWSVDDTVELHLSHGERPEGSDTAAARGPLHAAAVARIIEDARRRVAGAIDSGALSQPLPARPAKPAPAKPAPRCKGGRVWTGTTCAAR